MIAYQPAFDPYHSIFRMIRIIIGMNDCEYMELEKFRILDFYLVFPFLIENFKFKREDLGLRKLAKSYDRMRPYGSMPDSRDIFVRMAPIQAMASETLVARGLVDADAYKVGLITKGELNFDAAVLNRAEAANRLQSSLIDILNVMCSNYALLGDDGIKRRSGLMEYRYDAI